MSENTKSAEITFSDMDALDKYNVELLSLLVGYLNKRNERKRDVYHCGVTLRIDEAIAASLIRDFCDQLELTDE